MYGILMTLKVLLNTQTMWVDVNTIQLRNVKN